MSPTGSVHAAPLLFMLPAPRATVHSQLLIPAAKPLFESSRLARHLPLCRKRHVLPCLALAPQRLSARGRHASGQQGDSPALRPSLFRSATERSEALGAKIREA